MPIKFRCSYCHQFLGISRNRVGGIVDCPTCGRSIRVPGLDGVAAPLPMPEFDRADTQLARALDELAALVDVTVLRPANDVQSPLDDDVEIPQPLPEPEPVELPMAMRIAPIAVIPAELPASSEAEKIAAPLVLDDLLSSAGSVPGNSFAGAAHPQGTAAGIGFIAAALPCATLLLGLGLGWWGRGPTPPSTAVLPAAEVNPAPLIVADTELEGRVTYRTAEGETRPDIGALILAVPEGWDGQLRLLPIGLRPGDSEADQAAALKMVAAFGGGAVRADDAGRYRLPLADGGRFVVVIVSRFTEHADPSTLSEELRTELSAFLADPAATVGRRAVHVQHVTVAENQAIGLDHAF